MASVKNQTMSSTLRQIDEHPVSVIVSILLTVGAILAFGISIRIIGVLLMLYGIILGIVAGFEAVKED